MTTPPRQPQRLTKAQLFDMASSKNPDDRKRAFQIYQAWIQAAHKLPFQDRLTAVERNMLSQVFAANKQQSIRQPPGRRPTGPTSRPR
jgi:hypothetical protein